MAWPLRSSLWLIHNRSCRCLRLRVHRHPGSPDFDSILHGLLTCGSYIKLQTNKKTDFHHRLLVLLCY